MPVESDNIQFPTRSSDVFLVHYRACLLAEHQPTGIFEPKLDAAGNRCASDKTMASGFTYFAFEDASTRKMLAITGKISGYLWQ